jgi:hypothetical protein
MSRLESFIRRLSAQKDCIDRAAELIGDRRGPIVELGLGNGRTYDHLRQRFPGRDIFVFDRAMKAHPDCVPPPERLILGEFSETLALAPARMGHGAVFAHCDTGSGDRAATAAQAAWLGAALRPLLAPGAIVASDQSLDGALYEALELPATVKPGRYFLLRAR